MKFFKRDSPLQEHTKQRRRVQQTNQNTLNQSLFQPYSPGLPYVINDNMQSYVDDGYRKNANLYAVINAITRPAAAVPWHVYVVKDEKAHRFYKGHSGAKRVEDPIKANQLHKKALDLASESDLQGIMDRPNHLQGQSEFIENVLGFKLITGNSYVHGIDVNGTFGELWPLPAHIVEIISGGGLEDIIRGYHIRTRFHHAEFPAETVMHLKFWNPDYSSIGSHLYGMSPIQAATNLLTQSNDTYTANQRALQNMGAEGMISGEDENLTAEQRDQMQKQLRERGSGPENRKKILVSTAKWRWLHFGISPTDLNIIESMKMSLRDFCNIYGISSEVVNDPDNKTNSNKQESRKGLYHERVLPELDTLRDELNRWLSDSHSRRDGVKYFIDYDETAIPALTRDQKELVDWLQNAWWIPPNKKLQLQGIEQSEDPQMDVPWAPTNIMPVTSREEIELRELEETYGVELSTKGKNNGSIKSHQ